MRKLGLVLLLGCAAVVHAKIEYAHVFRDDRQLIAITQPFGFGSRGHLDLTISDITLWRRHSTAASTSTSTKSKRKSDSQSQPDVRLSNFGFFLSPWDAELALAQDAASGKCLLEDRELKLCSFADPKVEAVIAGASRNVTFHVEVNDGGLFALYYASCERATPASFALRVEQYNLVGPSGRRDYLSVGETELDVMYWVMFSLFSAIGIAWAGLLARSARVPGRVTRLHLLMGCLVAFKAASLLAQAVMFHVVERAGSAHGWNWVYYAFTAARGLLFFSVVVLIGTGWGLVRPFVDERTRQVLMVVLPLQVFANIAIIITSEESPAIRDWLTWRDIFHAVDLACCAAVLLPIVWSIKHLREAAGSDGKAARCLERLTLFRQFYVAVVLFVYFTRIVVFLLDATLEYRYRWLAAAAAELGTLAFYVWVGARFRPAADTPYSRLHAAEEVEMA